MTSYVGSSVCFVCCIFCALDLSSFHSVEGYQPISVFNKKPILTFGEKNNNFFLPISLVFPDQNKNDWRNSRGTLDKRFNLTDI